MNDARRFYVYVHRRASDGTIFYIGKGTGNRAWKTYEYFRSTWHHRVKCKYGLVVEIIKDHLTSDEAYDLEERLISEARVSGENIVNFMEERRITSEIARMGGKTSYDKKVGIHSLSKEERVKIAGEAGKIGGSLPWWNNSITGEETRSKFSPGENWVRGRSKSVMKAIVDKSKHSSFYDPDCVKTNAKLGGIASINKHYLAKTGTFKRVRCSCGKEMNIGNIRRHQAAKGCLGWEDI